MTICLPALFFFAIEMLVGYGTVKRDSRCSAFFFLQLLAVQLPPPSSIVIREQGYYRDCLRWSQRNTIDKQTTCNNKWLNKLAKQSFIENRCAWLEIVHFFVDEIYSLVVLVVLVVMIRNSPQAQRSAQPTDTASLPFNTINYDISI